MAQRISAFPSARRTLRWAALRHDSRLGIIANLGAVELALRAEGATRRLLIPRIYGALRTDGGSET